MRRWMSVMYLTAAISLPLVAQTVEPCTQNIQLTGGTTFTSNSSGNQSLCGTGWIDLSYLSFSQEDCPRGAGFDNMLAGDSAIRNGKF